MKFFGVVIFAFVFLAAIFCVRGNVGNAGGGGTPYLNLEGGGDYIERDRIKEEVAKEVCVFYPGNEMYFL